MTTCQPTRLLILLPALVILAATSSLANAADNELTPKEQAAGWQLLFDGKSLTGWKNNDGKPLAEGIVQEGTINTHGCGGYILVYDKEFADFEFQCDVKMAPGDCNSGLFFWISDLNDPVMTGREAQIFSPPGTTAQDFGAIYDLVPPSKIATKEPGTWNTMHLRCEGAKVAVTVNGEVVAEMDCDAWDQPGKRLDGTPHKFVRAIKDFARKGYLGLQDHGADVWFKNIKVREIK